MSAGGTPVPAEEHLRRLYYDLAGSPGSNALAPLLEMTERSHILYGSDYVHTPEAIVSAHLAELLSSKLLSADDFRAIARGNALALFPQLAQRSVNPNLSLSEERSAKAAQRCRRERYNARQSTHARLV